MKFPDDGTSQEQTQSDEVLSDLEREACIDDTHDGDELSGHLGTDPDHERLAHTVLEVNTDQVPDGMLVEEAGNQNLSSFLPDMMFKEMVKDYKNANKLYGNTIIRALTGYDPRFIDKNIKIPEFQRELQKKLKDKSDDLQEKGILSAGGQFSTEALDAAALFLINEEFKENTHGYSNLGEPVHKAANAVGDKSTIRAYARGDAFKDIAIRRTIKQAIRRGRTEIIEDDLYSFDREARQQVNIVYALDTSGSMKGEKLRLAKRAGVALAHRAIRDRNKVGLIIFDTQPKKQIPLTNDFLTFTRPLAICSPGQETDIAQAIAKGTELLQDAKGIKHIVLLTDGLHTVSGDPNAAVLEQVGIASSQDITISVVGISLDKLGEDMAKTIVDYSKGKLYSVHGADEIGGVVIADYNSLK
ncbi:VWA domain-containing protein [Candidatus Woesearchaeota archaeon]|nr:VWA domain-containing protein [Candidatus Woesearchaeota archaeon]